MLDMLSAGEFSAQRRLGHFNGNHKKEDGTKY